MGTKKPLGRGKVLNMKFQSVFVQDSCIEIERNRTNVNQTIENITLTKNEINDKDKA